MKKPPLTHPPAELDYSADYAIPRTYAQIGRALVLFLFNSSVHGDPEDRAKAAWVCEGVNRTNGGCVIDEDGHTHNPRAHPSHWMSPRGSWGGAEGDEDIPARVEWRCGWCGARDDSPEAQSPCP